jgi:hypothetical protein
MQNLEFKFDNETQDLNAVRASYAKDPLSSQTRSYQRSTIISSGVCILIGAGLIPYTSAQKVLGIPESNENILFFCIVIVSLYFSVSFAISAYFGLVVFQPSLQKESHEIYSRERNLLDKQKYAQENILKNTEEIKILADIDFDEFKKNSTIRDLIIKKGSLLSKLQNAEMERSKEEEISKEKYEELKKKS